ncbi:hypothetical protein ACFWG0_27575 [Streptomyces yangpuensis]|uniref:hypothetical protein n=1 Tax=Streptomyces yangpuensis TaxID=1648182 RepID=UPI003659E6F8
METTIALRRSRTRTKKVARREELVLSTLKPHQYDLSPYNASLVCPDCKTWVPITGIQAKIHKLVAHHAAGTAREGARIRCSGSNRKVKVDVRFDVWEKRFAEGSAETSGRRSARQHYKPMPAPAAPVTKMAAAPVSAADALDAYRQHLKKCRASGVAGRCGGTHRCADGARLAGLYEQLLRTQPHRDREHVQEARVGKLLDRVRSAQAAKKTAAEWARHHEATAAPKTELAKRSGTEVEEANNTRRIPAPGTVSHLRGAEVPLRTLHPAR